MMTATFQRPRPWVFLLVLLPGSGPVTGLCADPVFEQQATPDEIVMLQDGFAYDQVDAALPQTLASIPSQVTSQVHIALYQARQQASQELCGGRWVAPGKKVYENGPTLSAPEQPESASGRHWIYRGFRQAADIDCGGVSRDRFYREVSRHLPAWISIRPAEQGIAYRQGMPVADILQPIMAAH